MIVAQIIPHGGISPERQACGFNAKGEQSVCQALFGLPSGHPAK
jgi:hypothetical protein